MHYNETSQISLSNVMPSDTYTNDYFEFTIDGKNTTTNKDIWYEIVLNHGDNHETRTGRIKDNLLMFRLTEVNDNIETEIFTNKSFNNLENKRIYVNTINKNTTNEIKRTYRLYMWISNDTVIGNVNQNYTMEEWKDIFASIKVGVSGDFNEKYIIPETRCFTTDYAYDEGDGLSITDYDSSCGSSIIIPETIDGTNVVEIASNAFNNKGLIYVDIPSSVVKIGAYAFTENNITSINVPETVTNLHCKAFDDGVVKNCDMTCKETDASCFTTKEIKDYQVNSNMTDEELNKCTTYITNLNLSWYDGETVEAFCKGTGTYHNGTFQNSLRNLDDEEIAYFETNNIINLKDTYLSITDYNTSCGTDGIIPKSYQW